MVSLVGNDKSRRVASVENRSLPFRVSRYGVKRQPKLTPTSHGIAVWDPLEDREATVPLTVSPLQPICWYRITPAAPQCVKVPNLLAAVNAQRR